MHNVYIDIKMVENLISAGEEQILSWISSFQNTIAIILSTIKVTNSLK